MPQPISFNFVPSNLRIPGVFAEVNASQANTAQVVQRALVIGQMTAAATATPDLPIRVPSPQAAAGLFGVNSMLTLMVQRYMAIDPTREVWALPLSDNGNAKASGSIAFTGTATAAGTIWLYVGGQLVQTTVNNGMNAAQVAQAVIAQCQLQPGLPMTAAVDGSHTFQVDFTAANAGADAGDLTLILNLRGASAGQTLPAGITAAIVAPTGGATNPSLTAALAAALAMSFDFIVNPYTDAASIEALTAFMTDAAGGRWNPMKQLYGHVFGAVRGSYAALGNFCSGLSLNDQHQSFVGHNAPEPSYMWAASIAAVAAASLANNPAQAVQDIVVPGLVPPQGSTEFTPEQRNALLFDGISTWRVVGGQVEVENMITTYTTNAQGAPDNSYLELETMFQIAFVLRTRQQLRQTFGRAILVSDATRIPPNPSAPIVQPSTVKGALIAQQYDLQDQGIVQNADAFAANVVVQQNGANPNRLDILDPTALSDQLRDLCFVFEFTH